MAYDLRSASISQGEKKMGTERGRHMRHSPPSVFLNRQTNDMRQQDRDQATIKQARKTQQAWRVQEPIAMWQTVIKEASDAVSDERRSLTSVTLPEARGSDNLKP